MKRILLIFIWVCAVAHAQKFAGLALTPPMGWNTWNTFGGNINEALIRETAQAMIDRGLRDAGYTTIVIDDTWAAHERDGQGQLAADPAKFPSGLKALGDWLHARGFKFGLYSCAGPRTCAGYPGSWGHEFQDARQFAAWGVDYLKYDWCNAGTADARDAYTRMRDALHAAGRPVVLSICEWGQHQPWTWAGDVGQLWRTTGDIYDSYDGRKGWESGWKRLLDQQYDLVPSNGPDGIGKFAGPGHWNDPDMLEVGNPGLTSAESRAHFALWCIIAAPLMAGNDVRHMTPETQALLTDREVIAIDQDALGRQGFRAQAEPARHFEIWTRELSDGAWAVAVLNTAATPADITVDWSRLWMLSGKPFAVRDVWAKTAAGDTRTARTVRIASHDVALFRLTPLAS
jgi:alpha-galactosidase